LTGEPEDPAKLSLNTVVQPAGGAGTVVADEGWASTSVSRPDPNRAVTTAATAAVRRRRRANWAVAADLVSGIGCASCLGTIAIHPPRPAGRKPPPDSIFKP
jgi:hypothetical protein